LKGDFCKLLFPFFCNIFSLFKLRTFCFVKVMSKLMKEDMRKQEKTHKGNMCPPTWRLSQDFIHIKLNACRLALPTLAIKTQYVRHLKFSASAQEFFAASTAWQLRLAR